MQNQPLDFQLSARHLKSSLFLKWNDSLFSFIIAFGLIFFMGLIILLAVPSNAYYLERKVETFRFLERKASFESFKYSILTLQDNFSVFTDNIGDAPLLLPYSKHFVTADIVDVGVPLLVLFNKPAKEGNDIIANLLYANLKLKMLLKEYINLQKKANQSLAKNGQLNINIITQSSDNVSKLTLQGRQSLYDQLKAINKGLTMASISTVNKSSIESSIVKRVSSLKQLKKGTENQVLYSTARSFVDHSKLSTYKITTNGQSVISSGNENAQISNNGQEKDDSKKVEKVIPKAGNSFFVWMLEMPFNLVKYMVNNKVITLVVVFGFLFLLNIIFNLH